MPRSSQSTHDRRIALLLQRLDQTFKRLCNRSAQVSFEADQALLRRYLRQAYKLNAPIAIGRAWNALGVLFKIHGQFQDALDAFQVAINTAQANNYVRGQIGSLLNQSSVYGERGEHARVVDICVLAIPLIDAAQLEPSIELEFRMKLCCNLSHAHTLLRQYDHAEQQTHKFLCMWQDPSITSIDQAALAGMIGTIRAVRVAVFISREQFEYASNECDLLLDLGGRGFHSSVEIVIGNLFKLLLVLHVPLIGLSPDTYWNRALQYTEGLAVEQRATLWRTANQGYLYGAILFTHFGFQEWAMCCVRTAIELLRMVGSAADVTAAEVILHQLSTPSDK